MNRTLLSFLLASPLVMAAPGAIAARSDPDNVAEGRVCDYCEQRKALQEALTYASREERVKIVQQLADLDSKKVPELSNGTRNAK